MRGAVVSSSGASSWAPTDLPSTGYSGSAARGHPFPPVTLRGLGEESGLPGRRRALAVHDGPCSSALQRTRGVHAGRSAGPKGSLGGPFDAGGRVWHLFLGKTNQAAR